MRFVRRHVTGETLLKFSTMTLLVTVCVNFLGIGSTESFYHDEQSSGGNTLSAGAIDFTLSNGNFVPLEGSLNFQPSTTTQKIIGVTLSPISNPMTYHASTTNVTGDTTFCKNIHIDSILNNQNQFSGMLTDFISLGTTTIGNWQYTFSIAHSPSFYNSICSFDFQYTGRQTAPHKEYATGGYYDVEDATSTISSWGFRINKVYYDVASDRGVEGDNEWVEIYNQTDAALDLSGWKICDNNSCDTIPTSPLIPAKGFAVITDSSTTWNYFDPSSDVVKIALGGLIGNGLANDADMLMLKRPDGVTIDQMNWGIPNTSWANYNSGVWNPGAVDVPQGHALSRKPNGYDTNSPSDFVDLGMPTVTLTSPNQSGTLTWYWTYQYPITWTATNPNGPTSAIKINLSYIKDIDHSNTITPSDQTVSIATNLSNSGSYTWTVPSGFIGYIWIKIVAVGPENVMLNSKMISGKIYDPFPEDMWNNHRDIIIAGLRSAGLIDASTTPTSLAEAESIVDKAEGIVQDTSITTTNGPTITLLGNSPAEIPVGSTYLDVGATAIDALGNTLMPDITENNVDTSKPGEYQVVWTAHDSNLNYASSTRKVIVYDSLVQGMNDVINALTGSWQGGAGSGGGGNTNQQTDLETAISTNSEGTTSEATTTPSTTDTNTETESATSTSTTTPDDTLPPTEPEATSTDQVPDDSNAILPDAVTDGSSPETVTSTDPEQTTTTPEIVPEDTTPVSSDTVNGQESTSAVTSTNP